MNVSEVRSLLNCSSEITRARSLRGNEAQMFIDFLDRVSKLTILFQTTNRVEHRFSHGHASMTNTGGAVCGSSQRSTENTESYPPRIFFNKTSHTSGRFAVIAGSQS